MEANIPRGRRKPIPENTTRGSTALSKQVRFGLPRKIRPNSDFLEYYSSVQALEIFGRRILV
jgi:hypothetical protein